MNLYIISQTVNDDYDTFDSAIVAAISPEMAIRICPDSLYTWNEDRAKWISDDDFIGCCGWADISDVSCERIGTATRGTLEGVIIASYNAG